MGHTSPNHAIVSEAHMALAKSQLELVESQVLVTLHMYSTVHIPMIQARII